MLALVLPSRSVGLARKVVAHNRRVDYNRVVDHKAVVVVVVDSLPEVGTLRVDLDLTDSSWRSLSFELNFLLLLSYSALLTDDSCLQLIPNIFITS